MIVLISDFLAPVEMLQRNLAYLRSQRHEVILIRVLDPTELSFAFRDSAMFVDVESGRDLYIDPVVAKSAYLKRFEEHATALKEVCRELGAEFHQVAIDQPLDHVLFEFVSAQMQQVKGTTLRDTSTRVRRESRGTRRETPR